MVDALVRGVFLSSMHFFLGSSGVVDALVAGTEEQGVARMLVQPHWGLDLAAIARRVNDSGFEMDEAAAKVADAGAPLGPPSPRA